MQSLLPMLPYALEVARQLYDAHKAMYATDIELHWDTNVPALWSGSMPQDLAAFVAMGALRFGQGRIFLPRRRQRECPFHHEICLPTRENEMHWVLADQWYLAAPVGVKVPTFLVDLLDPWPRDLAAPTKKQASKPALPAALRYYIMQRDRFRCQLCGTSPQSNEEISLEVDHKISRAHGGNDTPENLQTLCHLCNSGKSLQDL